MEVGVGIFPADGRRVRNEATPAPNTGTEVVAQPAMMARLHAVHRPAVDDTPVDLPRSVVGLLHEVEVAADLVGITPVRRAQGVPTSVEGPSVVQVIVG